MADPWRDWLVKQSFSDLLLEDLVGQVPATTLRRLRAARCKTLREVRALRSAIRRLRGVVEPELFDELREELDEIEEDLRWSRTARGRYVLAINAWLEPFHAELRARFPTVQVGGHERRRVVFAAGTVASPQMRQDLARFLEARRPPFKLLLEVNLARD